MLMSKWVSRLRILKLKSHQPLGFQCELNIRNRNVNIGIGLTTASLAASQMLSKSSDYILYQYLGEGGGQTKHVLCFYYLLIHIYTCSFTLLFSLSFFLSLLLWNGWKEAYMRLISPFQLQGLTALLLGSNQLLPSGRYQLLQPSSHALHIIYIFHIIYRLYSLYCICTMMMMRERRREVIDTCIILWKQCIFQGVTSR
jgi:hypothetical protein